MGELRPVSWRDGALVLLDQRRLPLEETYVTCCTVDEAAEAIRDMAVRGAPAIGCAAAFGLALAASEPDFVRDPLATVEEAARRLAATRPTAVNLFWALERTQRAARRAAEASGAPEAIFTAMVAEAQAILHEDLEACRAMGRHGLELVPKGARILTHCNAGALATAGYGTALGVVRAAFEAGRLERVFATETRPRQQGARLTTWELLRDGIPTTLVPDTAVGWLLKSGGVDLVVVGADRIAANGDVANKIGTYNLAVLAARHGVPFYVAAPTSTLDLRTPTGAGIEIEHRSPEEVTHCGGQRIAAEGVAVFNPAFDVTEAELVAAIVTEKGVVRPPFSEGLAALLKDAVG